LIDKNFAICEVSKEVQFQFDAITIFFEIFELFSNFDSSCFA
jgi:hypothetical protein